MTGLRLNTKNSVAALFMAMTIVVLSSSASFAQRGRDDQLGALNARLDWLEQALIELQSTASDDVYGASQGDAPMNMMGTSGGEARSGDAALSRVLTRLDDLEGQIRSLTGQLEQVTFKIDQANREMEGLSKDTDFRLRQLEQGAPGRAMTPRFDDADVPLARGAPMPQSTPEEQSLGTIPVDPETGNYQEDYDGALSHLRRGEHENAEKSLRMFLDNHGDSELAGNAQYWLGESYYVREMWRPAAQSFLICVQKFKSGLKAPDCMLKLGMSLASMGEKDKACKTLSEINRRFPDASQTIRQRARSERQRNNCR